MNIFAFMKCKIILAIWICCISVHGQIDKKFWFAAPDISSMHADHPILLRIATLNQKATIKISIPASNIVIDQFALNANDIKSVDLTSRLSLIESGHYGSKRGNGLLIESNEEITAYYEVRGEKKDFLDNTRLANCDIYALKGSNALGTEFLLPMQNYWQAAPDASDAWASFQIVATEDNTLVEITPTQNLSRLVKDVTFSITLNKGEVFSERAANKLPSEKPTGTQIKSNKKVAVTITDDSMYDTVTKVFGAWDTGGDQIIPIAKTGKEYIINKIYSGDDIDRIFVTATEDQTEITLNGVSQGMIDRGKTVHYLLNTTFNHLVSSKPVYLFHVGGFDSELAGALLPPIGCTGSKKVTLALNYINTVRLNIVVEKGGESSFVLNGNSNTIKASDFRQLPNTDYLCANIALSASNQITKVIVENSIKSFQLGLLNQEHDDTFVYGYFSDFGSLDLPDTTGMCSNTLAHLNAGFGKDSYAWYQDNALLTHDKSFLDVSTVGKYKVKAQKGVCVFEDSTEVIQYQTVSSLFSKDSALFCFNAQGSIGIASGKYSSMSWSTGEKTSKIFPKTPAFYSLTVEDSNLCVVKDSMYYGHFPYVPLQTRFPEEKDYCGSVECTSIALKNSYQSYYLNDTLLSSIDIEQLCVSRNLEHRYVVKVIDAYNCVQKDSIQYECSSYIGQIPNVISPKTKDGLNDFFWIPKLMQGYWQLDVYNRYGIKVHEDNNYNNNWDAEEINSGVYFYELTHKFKHITYKGWIEVR